MDRFKFRIWDIKKNKYRQGTANLADTCLDCLLGKVIYGEGMEIYGEEDEKDVILEQCTGLKDNNGKLMYEGDIVYDNDVNELGVIVFNEVEAKFGVQYYNDFCDFSYGYELELYGNIHENPELLEANND